MSPALQQEYQSMQLRMERMAAVPGASDNCALGAVCGSAPGGMSGASVAAGLCFKPTYCWHGSSHVLEPISSSYSSCSEWARQHRPQQQQEQEASATVAIGDVDGNCSSTAAAEAEAGSESDNLAISKLDVPAAAKQVKRKGGMLTELLSKSKPVQQQQQQQQQQQCAAAQAQQAQQRQAGSSRSHHAHTSSADSVGSIGSCGVAASDSSASSSDSTCSSACYSTSSDDHAAAPAGVGGQEPQLPRLKWLPVECAKRDRSSLKQHLQEALEFVSAHLAAGHLVLLHDVDGEPSTTAALHS
jgi:hypothetical protein